jgi:hypothetical protein
MPVSRPIFRMLAVSITLVTLLVATAHSASVAPL